MGRYEKQHNTSSNIVETVGDIVSGEDRTPKETIITDKETGDTGKGLGRTWEEADDKAFKDLKDK